MIKKLIVIAITILISLLLFACDSIDVYINQESPTKESEEIIDVEDIKINAIVLNENALKVEALYKGKVLWEHKSDDFVVTQLETVQEIGIIEDEYWYLGEGTVYALDIYTGLLQWKNSDFEGASALIEHDDENVYLSGYLGPDLYVINHDGDTVKRIQSLTNNNNTFGPTKMELNNDSIEITYSSNDTKVSVDLSSYEATVLENKQQFSMDKVVSASATSSLSENNMTHSADRAIDGYNTTAWVEGVEGQGYEESITLYFDDYYEIENIVINAGYQKTSYLYTANSVPSKISISFSDNSRQEHILENIRDSQNISLGKSIKTKYVKITIEEVLPGDVYDDTAISEIRIY